MELENGGMGWQKPVEFLPDNEKTAEIMKKRAEEEELKRQKMAEMRALQEKQDKQKKAKEKAAQADQARNEKLRQEKEEARLKAEEENSNLSGRLQIILQALYDQDTPFEYTMTGIDKFNDIKCLLVAKQLAYNSTLKSIHIVRKEMKETSGMVFAKMLNTNKTLRKLELEGNLLGPKSATEFGKALTKNKTLKYLDLESNQLTLDGQEFRGIYDLVEFLKYNTTLLSLNLANNQMDEECGRMFRE